MTKKLNEDAIVNELRGNSAFFRRPSPIEETTRPPNATTSTSQPPKKEVLSVSLLPPERSEQVSPPRPPSSLSGSSMQPSAPENSASQSSDASALASNQASLLASYHASIIDIIRKTVKSVGKEVTFVRLTPEEKKQLSDIAYTYKRQGMKTSENEISRIAINFLLEDYKTNGEASVLAKVLASLLA